MLRKQGDAALAASSMVSPPNSNGRARASSSLRVNTTAARGSLIAVCTTANSSPPNRATVAGAKVVAQPFAHRAQLVADQVAERIVDPLEAVQVQQQHGDLALIAPRLTQRVLQMILEQGAVRQIGQRTMCCAR